MKRIRNASFDHEVKMDAVSGRMANQIDINNFKKEYDFYILIIGGNDVNYHEFKNPEPKTPQQTAEKLCSCQLF